MAFRGLLVIVLAVFIGGFPGGNDAIARAQDEAPFIRITHPSDLAAAATGGETRIEWNTSGLETAGTLEVWFRPPDGDWQVIARREPGPGSLTWIVPDVAAEGVGRIWVGNLANPDGKTTEEKYEAYHEIKLRLLSERPVPSLQITNPSPGDTLTAGSEARIEWDASNLNHEGTLEIWVRLSGEDWQKLDTRGLRQLDDFIWPTAQVEQATSAKIWIGNLTNPDGKGNVERYEVFDEVEVRIVPECRSQQFKEIADQLFGEQGTLLAAWHQHHETGLSLFTEDNYEAAIENFETYLGTLREIQTRLTEDADGNGTPDLVDQFGETDAIRRKLQEAIDAFDRSITKYADFVRLRQQAAQAFVAGNTDSAEQLVSQSDQAVDRHVELTDKTIAALQDVRDRLEELPCRP